MSERGPRPSAAAAGDAAPIIERSGRVLSQLAGNSSDRDNQSSKGHNQTEAQAIRLFFTNSVAKRIYVQVFHYPLARRTITPSPGAVEMFTQTQLPIQGARFFGVTDRMQTAEFLFGGHNFFCRPWTNHRVACGQVSRGDSHISPTNWWPDSPHQLEVGPPIPSFSIFRFDTHTLICTKWNHTICVKEI